MFAVLDVETTGLGPARDRIIEIAIVRVDEEGNLVDEWCTLVNAGPGVGVTEKHRITRREVADAPSFDQVVGDVLSRLGDHVVVAHNARFARHGGRRASAGRLRGSDRLALHA